MGSSYPNCGAIIDARLNIGLIKLYSILKGNLIEATNLKKLSLQ